MLDRYKEMLGIIQNVEIVFEIEVRNDILNINFYLISTFHGFENNYILKLLH